MMLYALLILSISGSVICKDHVYEPGHCPNIQAMQNFDVSKFMGVWYKVLACSFPNGFPLKCATYNFTLNDDNSFHSIYTTMRLRDDVMVSIPGKWRFDPANAAKTRMTSSNNLNERTVSILDTDYISYAFVHKCVNSGLQHLQYAWLYARDQHPPASVLAVGDRLIAKYKLPKTNFKTVVQTDCTLHPR